MFFLKKRNIIIGKISKINAELIFLHGRRGMYFPFFRNSKS